jgi:hypothetical protein
MGLIGWPGTVEVERGSRRSCPPGNLFSRGVRGGAAVGVGWERQGSEGSVRVLKEPVPSDLGRGGNRGSRSQELVTIEVQGFAPCWPWEEPTGLADGWEKSRRRP